LLEETIAAAETARDRRIELRARLQRAAVQLFTEPEGMVDYFQELTAEAVPVLEELGDDRGLAYARYVIAFIEGAFRCHYEISGIEARRALEHYRRAGWPVAPAVRLLATALFWGPTPVAPAIDRCSELLPEVGRVGQAEVSTYLAGLEAMRGEFSRGRDLLAEAKKTFDEYRLSWALATLWAPIATYVELLAGDTERAVSILLGPCEALETLGRTADLSSHAGLLADVLFAQGRLAEADSWTERAAACAAESDVHAQISWRPVRAKLLAADGAIEQAERLARATVGLAQATDALNLHGKVLLDLAEILRLGGKEDEAALCAVDAIALYERKGNAVAAEAARARLAELLV
jgi:tetratricopeptide (TPR) repeat protein